MSIPRKGEVDCHDGGRPRALDCAALLILPRVSDSLNYRPFLEGADEGKAVIEYVLERFPAGLQIGLTCYSRKGCDELDYLLTRYPSARTVLLEPRPAIYQLRDAATAMRAANLALLRPGSSLLPASVILQAIAGHLDSRNDLTEMPSVSDGARPVIVSTRLLQRLCECVPPTADLGPEEWIHLMRGSGADDACEGLRLGTWDWHATSSVMPARVRIEDRAQWLALRGLLRDGGPDGKTLTSETTGDAELISAWPRCGWNTSSRAARPSVAVRAARSSGPRILYVSASTGFAGGEMMFARLATGLVRSGASVSCRLVLPGVIASLLPSEVRVHGDGVAFGQPTLASHRYCLEMLRAEAPDVLHCNGFSGWPLLAAAYALNVPVVQHVRVAELAGAEDQLVCAAALAPVSNFVAGELTRLGAPAHAIHVCHDGIDTAHFMADEGRRAEARRRLGLQQDARVVLCVARCTESKQLHVAVEAVGELGRMRPVNLLIVGELEQPLYYERVRGTVARYQQGMSVTWHHGVGDIRLLYDAADALVLPSRRDPFPTCILEAMAMEVPIVAAASGGIVEMLDAETGFLVSSESSREYSAALQRIFDGCPDVRDKTAAARRRVCARFGIEQHVGRMLDIYQAVLQGTTRPARQGTPIEAEHAATA